MACQFVRPTPNFNSSILSDPMRRSVLPILMLTFLLAGCDGGDVVEQKVAQVQVRIEIEDLPVLHNGFQYRVWARRGFEYLATEGFNKAPNGGYLNGAGQFVQNSFVFEDDISEADLIVLSIESKAGAGEEPSGSIIMAGEVVNSVAQMSTAHRLALGTSFASAAGSFMLFNNTIGAAPTDISGVWFASNAGGSTTGSLSLPELPAEWVYEGWVNVGGTMLSTGTFSRTDRNDDNRRYSESDTPQFPGEDFLIDAPQGVTFPLNPSGGTVMVTVEPVPDDRPEPFGITVLSGAIPASPAARTPYAMTGAVTAPSGKITLF